MVFLIVVAVHAGSIDSPGTTITIYRDIKPPNIMIKGDKVKLIDFGLSCLRCKSGGTPGSPIYIPPSLWMKKAQNKPITFSDYKHHDVFSVGYTILELMLGMLPADTTLPSFGSAKNWRQPYSAVKIRQDLKSIFPTKFHPLAQIVSEIMSQRLKTIVGVKRRWAQLKK